MPGKIYALTTLRLNINIGRNIKLRHEIGADGNISTVLETFVSKGEKNVYQRLIVTLRKKDNREYVSIPVPDYKHDT
ncbi:hypothetical protein AAIB48_00385 (plasmid) [Paraclostridium benzoelyticum]|uniref:hypothetical protein n=1 Tax=Paraclostridium benzoelyticum TaxID=1629550 RepID=UPI0031CCE27B